jgi:hypothetical protein
MARRITAKVANPQVRSGKPGEGAVLRALPFMLGATETLAESGFVASINEERFLEHLAVTAASVSAARRTVVRVMADG